MQSALAALNFKEAFLASWCTSWFHADIYIYISIYIYVYVYIFGKEAAGLLHADLY